MVINRSGAIIILLLLVAACQPAPGKQVSTESVPATQEIHTPESLEVTKPASPTVLSNSTSIPTRTQQPDQSEPSVTATRLAPSEEMLLPVGDMDLVGTVYYPQNHAPKWPAVILIHMLHGDRSQWEEFPEQLSEAGYAVLSIDLRGHGASGGAVDWELAIEDLQQVWNEFTSKEEIDPERTAFIGASIGANLSLIASSNEPSVRTAILLSPGLSYAGVETEQAMEKLGDKPVLIAASDDDAYAANSSTTLAEIAKGESKLVLYQEAGHGTLMFRSEPELAKIIIDWLDLYLQ
jgi:alpha-beta hydrolase superfamily lysophospholipase